MGISIWLDTLTMAVGFGFGVVMVHKLTEGSRRRAAQKAAMSGAGPGRPSADSGTPTVRPQQQIPVQGFDDLVATTATQALLRSLEQRTRLSAESFRRDCLPVLETFAEFVQMLPASEAHHHAQPGGLWVHALEVVDAALTFRAGLELPPGASTEDRKRQEHRWTFAVFAASLLHDVGKPVTDVKVTLYGEDPRAGRAWAPMAGPMKTFGVHWYSVAFGDPSERDYKAHTKLPAMLFHSFVQQRVMRWLAEEGDVLAQLLAYLSGEDPDGVLGSIVKKADSDSVRRNLLQGSRTRFASARTRPLIERLMEALRRMLHEGAVLPLNRPGAAGWVYDDKIWFVCARLADEVRTYLAQHESSSGVPGKDRNDRLFDTWQEHGAIAPAPDGGAIWRVRVECDAWSPPDALTVLAFPLDKLYPPGSPRPTSMRGRVWVPGAGSVAGVASAPASAPATDPAPAPAKALAVAPEVAKVLVESPRANSPVPRAPAPAPVEPLTAMQATSPVQAQTTAPVVENRSAEAAVVTSPTADAAGMALPPATAPVGAAVLDAAAPAAEHETHAYGSAGTETAVISTARHESEYLDATESAQFEPSGARVTTTPELGAPLRPKERHSKAPSSLGSKGPSPAATAFMAWVANGVGTGAIKYNEEAAPVHFVREGALLLTPEIFRRFLSEHEAVPDGPIAALRASHGERAFARLQNELAKSGWAVRNGDENVHHYAFTKADNQLSRPASFFLIGRPELFWNPVPTANDRIRLAPRPKKMSLPAATAGPAAHGPHGRTAPPALRPVGRSVV